MGRGDNRNSPKMRRKKAQTRLKNRIKNRRVAAAAVRAEKKAATAAAPAAKPAKSRPLVRRFPLLRHSFVRHAHPCFSQNIVIRSFLGTYPMGWRADYVASHGFVGRTTKVC